MDHQERYVCRHLRHRIAEHLNREPAASYEFALKIFEQEESKLREIKTDTSKELKPEKLLEFVANSQNRETAEAFWAFLRLNFPDLHDELQIEVVAERGELALDQRLRKEARHQVQRTFGVSKHLSEREKNKLEQLLTVRMQVQNDCWSRKLDRASALLTRSEEALRECDDTVGSAVLDLEERFEVQKRRMLKFLPEEKQRRIKSMIMRHNREYPSRRQVAWKRLESSLARKEVLFDYCLACSEEMTRERAKVLKLLNVHHDWLTVELDKEVRAAVGGFHESIARLKETIGEQRRLLKAKEEEMERMARERAKQSDDKECEVQRLKVIVKRMQQISIKFEADLTAKREELEETKNELSRCRVKCQSLEITRRLLAAKEAKSASNAGDGNSNNNNVDYEGDDDDGIGESIANRKSGNKLRGAKTKSSTLPKLTHAKHWGGR